MVEPPDWIEPEEPESNRRIGCVTGGALESAGAEPELLIALAEALLETGERERAIRHLAKRLRRTKPRALRRARRVVDELLQLDVNDVRAYQKRVELALMAKDREGLISAYLDLADCLDRTDATNKARIVVARVLEIDPMNRRARQALELLGSEERGAAPRRRGQRSHPGLATTWIFTRSWSKKRSRGEEHAVQDSGGRPAE